MKQDQGAFHHKDASVYVNNSDVVDKLKATLGDAVYAYPDGNGIGTTVDINFELNNIDDVVNGSLKVQDAIDSLNKDIMQYEDDMTLVQSTLDELIAKNSANIDKWKEQEQQFVESGNIWGAAAASKAAEDAQAEIDAQINAANSKLEELQEKLVDSQNALVQLEKIFPNVAANFQDVIDTATGKYISIFGAPEDAQELLDFAQKVSDAYGFTGEAAEVFKQGIIDGYEGIGEAASSVVGFVEDVNDALQSIEPLKPEDIFAFNAQDQATLVTKEFQDYYNKIQGQLNAMPQQMDNTERLRTALAMYQAYRNELGAVGQAQESFTDILIANSDAIDNYQTNIASLSSVVQHVFDGYEDPNTFIDDVQTLATELAKFGEEMDLSSISMEEFGEIARELADNELQQLLDQLGIAADSELGEALAEAFDLSELQSSVSGVTDSMNELSSAYNTLRATMDAYNETGTLTYGQLSALLSLEPQYLALLESENGQLSINQTALANLVEVQKLRQEIVPVQIQHCKVFCILLRRLMILKRQRLTELRRQKRLKQVQKLLKQVLLRKK